MIQLSINKRLLLVASVLLLLVPLAACAVTTPEIHAKIVDAQTGKPQEWIKVVVYAGKPTRTLGGEVEPTLFTKTLYYDSGSGQITIPSQQFSVFDIAHYKGWKLYVKTPGHDLISFKGSDILKLIKRGSAIKLRGRVIARRADSSNGQIHIMISPYSDGIGWESGYAEDSLSAHEIPKDPTKQIKLNAKDEAIHSAMLIEEFRDLISGWSKYSRFPSGRMRDHGLLSCAREYVDMLLSFYCSSKSKVLERPRKLFVEAGDLFESLINETGSSNELKELRNRLLKFEKGGCK